MLDEAKKEGIELFEVAIFVKKNETFLLLENNQGPNRFFFDPVIGSIKEGESWPIALERVLLQKVGLALKKVIKYVAFRDLSSSSKKIRRYYFVVEVYDPEDLNLKEYHSYAWVELLDAVGYPVREDLREILDLLIKIKELL
jgi:hypothetical protein